MAKFILSPEAQSSLKNIRVYSTKNLVPRERKLTSSVFEIDLMSYQKIHHTEY